MRHLIHRIFDTEPAVAVSGLVALSTQVVALLLAFGVIGPADAEGYTSTATIAVQTAVPVILGAGVWIRQLVTSPQTARGLDLRPPAGYIPASFVSGEVHRQTTGRAFCAVPDEGS